jgi:hypothetical protein
MTEPKPQNRHLGYTRVSTYGQTIAAQFEQLRAAGCTKIYGEKVTGARTGRRELLKMRKVLAPGELVAVTRIDHLARSTFDLLTVAQAHRGRQGAIPNHWRRRRHRHQHRSVDDCRIGRPRRRGARSNPHPHRRTPRPGAKARPAHGPTACPHTAAAERGHPTPRAGRYARRIGRSYNVGISTIRRATRAA